MSQSLGITTHLGSDKQKLQKLSSEKARLAFITAHFLLITAQMGSNTQALDKKDNDKFKF